MRTDAGQRPSPLPSERSRLHWWTEVALIIAVYVVYSAIRNKFGSATVSPEHAFTNARHVVTAERHLGLFFEESMQDLFLGYHLFLRFWNIFYGTFHFWVTAFALIYTYRRYPERYPLWRNTLLFTTLLALLGFMFFPLMPPRLLDACTHYGGCASYGFVDTLAHFGGLWSFDSGTMQEISNQYAAMPSLHFAWSSWCCLVLYHYLPWRPARIAILVYPWVTLFAIIVTGNHYWLDALGGAVVLAGGYTIAWTIREVQRRFAGRVEVSASPA